MSFTRNIYGPLFRLITGLIILAVINWILTSIPMVKEFSIPGLPVTIAAIISVIVGIIMIIILLNFSRDFTPAMRYAWPSFPESGRIVSSGVTLAIIIVAYLMFDDFFRPFVGGYWWVYTLVFLVLAIYPTCILVITLYKGSGNLADIVTAKVAQGRGELRKCPACGELVTSQAKYCPNCSSYLAVPQVVRAVRCSNCGEENKAGANFCMFCATPLQGRELIVYGVEEEEEFEIL